MHVGRDPLVQIIPVHADIQAAGRDSRPPNLRQERAQPPGQRHSAALDAHQDHLAASLIALGDLVCNAGEGALHGGRG